MNRLVTASIVTLLLVGCNSILQNEPGELATDDGTSNDSTNPSPPSGSTSSGGQSSGSTPPQPVGGDAGQQTPPDGGLCGTGQLLCNSACVMLTDPLYGCGDPACSPCKVAHATAACQGRTCAVAACDAGFADCDKDPANGCEVDLSKATSCGACNAVCPATSPVCAPSGASFACGTGCTAIAPLLCGAECVDPASSENHCGACNAPCADVANGTTECTAGACGFTCKPGYNKCGAACTVNTDPGACGPACTVCPTPANATPVCSNDSCTFQCAAGNADCNLNPADGCESVLATDPANCGLCGRACPVGSTCEAGACSAVDGGT